MSKKAKRVLALLNEPKHTNRRLASLNESTLDDGAATVGKGDQEIKVLKERNEVQEFENENWSRGSDKTEETRQKGG